MYRHFISFITLIPLYTCAFLIFLVITVTDTIMSKAVVYPQPKAIVPIIPVRSSARLAKKRDNRV